MYKKILSLFSTLFIISAIAEPVYADQTVFGPEDLIIGNLYVHLSSHPFSVDDSSGGVLAIVKNTPDKEIWGGFCVLNGEYISLSAFLNGTGTIFEEGVDLSSNNRITIFLGGTPDASIKVEIKKKDVTPPPEVTFSVDPTTIYVGQSSTLSWTSSNADTCVIEPDIGSVDLSGSTAVSPTETTTYTINASSSGGSDTENVLVTVIPPISLSITSPADGENISRPDVMVQGTVLHALGFETGVTVNGIVAIVSGDQFFANHVPLKEGENIIAATATETQGSTAEASVIVSAEAGQAYIKLTALPVSGISPFETELFISGSFGFTESSLTHSGHGTVEFLESSPEEYRVRISQEGIYHFTAEATDPENNIRIDTITIAVLDQAQLDQLLKDKWDGMNAALSNGDIETAISYISERAREMYEYNFNLLSTHLSEISADLQNIELVKISDGMAEYSMVGEQGGQTYSFYVLFVQDTDGIWRIQFF